MLEIHTNAAVDDYAHLRAAEVRRGALRVAPVYLGPGSTVCTRAVVGPGGVVPQGATLGPYMSWRELDVTNPKTMAQMEEHRKIARMRQPQPGFGSQMLAWPIVFVCEVVAWIPWIFVFVVLIRSQGLYLSIPGEGGLHVDGTWFPDHVPAQPRRVHQELAGSVYGCQRRRGKRNLARDVCV